ncbi:YjgP/YjgQ family permease [Bacteroidetes/Chlorobi group bacterium Naka2016]|jgi:lipopolysaccharide export system permease protein|nr:MAG: YjgP/YjgQ family permease [Bacteroidetes/Chlorobi group bacterium Naka2016]
MIVYRYLTRLYLQIFIFSIIALLTIFIIVNMIENLDEFLDNNATTYVIAKYYLNFTPEVLRLVTPISVLVGILFSLGRLSTLNEITALKSGGFSLYQLILPYIIFNIILSFGLLYFNGWIVPRANEKRFVIERKYLKKEIETRSVYNFFFRDNPTRNVSFQFYDPDEFRGQNIFIEDFSSAMKPRIVKRTEAKSFRWDEKSRSWIIYDVIVRNLEDGPVRLETYDSLELKLRIEHRQLMSLQRKVEEMTFDELREYLDLLSKGGKDVRRQLIKYYAGYAFPFSCLILVFFAVPFASIKRRGGIALQIASAMTFSFLYLFFTEIGQILVYTTTLHPAIGGWIANLVFLIFGLIILFKTRT